MDVVYHSNPGVVTGGLDYLPSVVCNKHMPCSGVTGYAGYDGAALFW